MTIEYLPLLFITYITILLAPNNNLLHPHKYIHIYKLAIHRPKNKKNKMKHDISISNFTSYTRLQVVQAENLDTNSSQYKNIVAIGAAQKRSLTAHA